MADLVVTAGNVLAGTGAKTKTVTAGVTITAGQTVYKDASDSGKYKLAIDTSVAASNVEGIALHGASNGQPLTILTGGSINPGATVAVGVVYGVTDTGGGIGAISERNAGDYISVIGIGTTTTNIAVNLQVSGIAMA